MATWHCMKAWTMNLLLLLQLAPVIPDFDYNNCPQPKPGHINVHMVPHTHNDPGWLQTLDQYFEGACDGTSVRTILDSVVAELKADSRRRFVYVETVYFTMWWKLQNGTTKNLVRKLVREGRLEFAGGGWTMHDEAVTHYQSLIDQMSWGFRELDALFGKSARPRVGWQIDPFGHSRESASLMARFGFDGVILSRLDFKEMHKRLKNKSLEMIWETSPNLGNEADLFTSVLFDHYSFPLVLDGQIADNHTALENAIYVVDLMTNWAKFYKSENILLPLGNDFSFQKAGQYFGNIDRILNAVNDKQINDSKVNLFYSTPSCYVKAVNDEQLTFPTKTEDFFPYASEKDTFWTGYYTSRPALKYFVRFSNNFLQICKQLFTLANLDKRELAKLNLLRQTVALLQHHNAVTGTSRQVVAFDYAKKLYNGLVNAEELVRSALSQMMTKSEDTLDFDREDSVRGTTCTRKPYNYQKSPTSYQSVKPTYIPENSKVATTFDKSGRSTYKPKTFKVATTADKSGRSTYKPKTFKVATTADKSGRSTYKPKTFKVATTADKSGRSTYKPKTFKVATTADKSERSTYKPKTFKEATTADKSGRTTYKPKTSKEATTVGRFERSIYKPKNFKESTIVDKFGKSTDKPKDSKEVLFAEDLERSTCKHESSKEVLTTDDFEISTYKTEKSQAALTVETMTTDQYTSQRENSTSSDVTLRSCWLLNISSCDVTESSDVFVVTVYNPLSRLVSRYVRIPVQGDGSNYIVSGPSGVTLKVQVVPIPYHVQNVPGRTSSATVELVFYAKNIPALGFKSFHVSRNTKNTASCKAKIAKVEEKKADKITILANGVKVKQTFLWYKSSCGLNGFKSPSGAYIFEADGHPVEVNLMPEIKTYSGPLVDEIHQVFSDWVTQVIRRYKDSDVLEYHWLIGPIPDYDDVGREIITRYSVANIASNKTFFTDSNGREMSKRVRKKTPYHTYPEAGNYYPITTRIMIKDNRTQFSVITDRSQGGSSLKDSQIVIMLHRRCACDDVRGLGEVLSEEAFGTGLVVRGTHYVTSGHPRQQSAVDRLLIQERVMGVWTFLTPTTLSYPQWKKKYNMQFSGLKKALPSRVQILTLEPWKDGCYLIRLEHVLEKNDSDDDRKVKHVTVDITDIFVPFTITGIKETTLGGNQWLEESARLVWTKDDGSVTSGKNECPATLNPLLIKLKPMQIRSFIINLEFE